MYDGDIYNIPREFVHRNEQLIDILFMENKKKTEEEYDEIISIR